MELPFLREPNTAGQMSAQSFCTDLKQIAYPVSVQSGTPASCGKYKDDEIHQHTKSMQNMLNTKQSGYCK